ALRLVLGGHKPLDVRVCEERVKRGKTLDDPVGRQRPSKSAVCLADGSIESLVLNVVDASAIVPAGVRRREPAADQFGEEVPLLLTMDDAGERGVLPKQADAGVLHHEDEKARLALSESEIHHGCDTVVRV